MGRPSTTRDPLLNYLLKATDPVNVNVTWRVEGGPESGTVTPTGTTGIYTAPCKTPPVNPVYLTYFIRDSRIPFSPTAIQNAKVYILPKYWVGEIDILAKECGMNGGGDYTYTNASITFALDENLGVTDVVPGASVAPTIVLVPKCANDACSYSPGPAPPPRLFVSDAKAKGLSTSYGTPEFSIMVRVPLTPEVTEICPNGDRRVIPGGGQSQPIEFSVGIPHAPNFSSNDPLGALGVATRLRALPDPACPDRQASGRRWAP